MVSTAGGIVIAILVLLTVAAVGWVVYAQMRARRLGLPPPTLSSYLPWKRSETPYGPPQPAPGGVVGWFNDQIRKMKNRNNRSATGAYERPLQGGSGGRRGFGPLDPDEAWDARVGHEADGYGYYEEQELGRHTNTEYAGGSSYNMDLAATPGANYDDDERGRRPGWPGAAQNKNPFDDDAVSSLRGVSPRPIDAAAGQSHKPKPSELESGK
ncbi:uncharacterized protein MAM_04280 [Metarhizium album ARSEF 1941]|uniref:Acid phosphatase-like protein n=1 Tax=Metarhizium album (strain ARSEF 1941) TaxID=1081103 RepID=A0A0B2WPC6_METAS|nr:uncharacterized protein MAM_04280 [Metarhizium album ARSEF 1941]KHN97891.1 hypothetical protein MAM_04280 [Metarhizium album ARSEF 1941]